MARERIEYVQVPAAQGAAWLRRAFGMFRAHRVPWVLLYCGYFATLFVAGLVPFAGSFAVFALKPVLAVGLLAAAWSQERGGVPAMRQLFHGFRSNVIALLAIGAFFVLALVLAMQVSAVVDGGKLRDLASGGAALTEEQLRAVLSDSRVQLAMLAASLVAFLALVATWWAPALVVFQDAGAPRALATSFAAAVANWRALGVYFLCTFFFYALLPTMAVTVLALLFPTSIVQALIVLLLLPYSIVLTVILHIADYVSYRDVFHADETLAPLPPGTVQ